MRFRNLLSSTTFVMASVFAFGQTWTQLGSDLNGEASEDESGRSVAISEDGNTVAVGAPNNNGNGSNAGHVRVYEWNGTVWNQKGSDLDGDASNQNQGRGVALSANGNTVAIGANGTNGGTGHARIYEWNGTAWTQKGVDIEGEASLDLFGWSLTLSSDGNIVAVSGLFNDGNGSDSGHVRVYEWDGTTWNQRGVDIDGEAAGDRSGRGVSLSSDGSILAIGAEANDGNGGAAGHVRVFEWNGTTWTQRGLDIDGEATLDLFGYSVSLSADGNIVAVGASEVNSSEPGYTKVYQWDGTTWVQRGMEISGEAAADRFGTSVSLSSDGNIVAVGASEVNSSGTGYTKVYQWDETTWVQRGMEISGEAAADRFGASVGLSADGNTLIAGAFENDGTGTDAGHARVYSICTGYLDVTTTVNQATITVNESGADYQWVNCDNNNAPIAGEIGQSFTATANGNYAVIVTKDGCSETSTCTSFTTIGINELSENMHFVVFPNPSKGAVTVQCDQPMSEVTIKVTDLQGKVISESHHASLSQTEVQLGEAKGVYFVSVASATYTSRVKIMKH